MKRAKSNLPEGYREIYSVDLQKDKKASLFVNVLALVIMFALAVPMHFYIPFSTLTDKSEGTWIYCAKWGVIIVGMVVYLILHELVHGMTMKFFGTKKVKYGFTGLYAYAGSDDYFDKKAYIIIALAPIVVWGIVLGIINTLVPYSWFWVVYFIQIMNISGAAGDLFVTFKFFRMPKDILVGDNGVGMKVYSKEGSV